MITKKEIREIPFFGWLYAVTGNILIDRSDRAHALGRLREAEEAILERGVSVWIFPEGTRFSQRGELLPFKKGPFHMAIATGAPLVLVVVSPLMHVIGMKRRRVRPGVVDVEVLPPIPVDGMGEADLLPLISEAHQQMRRKLREMAAHQGLPLPKAAGA